MVVVDWAARMLGLDDSFLCKSGQGGGIILVRHHGPLESQTRGPDCYSLAGIRVRIMPDSRHRCT